MSGYKINKRGRYQCSFCTHPSYKIYGALISHLNTKHELEFKLAQKDDEIERLSGRKPRVEIREKVVYRDPPKKPDPKFWYTGVFCTSCKIAYGSVGVPYGQTLEETPHSNCGTKSLVLCSEVIR